jgi:ABC-type Mn2+/Zn2+ transport system permease subunit
MNLSKTSEIKFNDVYYVPRLTMNLILVGSLVDQSFVIVFDNEKCLVFVEPNHAVVHGVPETRTNLYQYIMDFLFVLWNFIL